MSDNIELVTSVRLAGESTVETYRRELKRTVETYQRELKRWLDKNIDFIVIPIGDFQSLLKVAEAAKVLSPYLGKNPATRTLLQALKDLETG